MTPIHGDRLNPHKYWEYNCLRHQPGLFMKSRTDVRKANGAATVRERIAAREYHRM